MRAVLRYPLSLQIAPLYSSLVRSSSLHCTKLSDSLYTLPVGRDIEWKQWSGPKPIDLYAEVLDVKSTRIWVLCCCTMFFFFYSEADHQILFNLGRKVVVIFLTQAVTLFIVPYLFNIFTLNVKARKYCLYLFTHSLMHVTPYNYDAVYRNSIFIQNTNQYA